MDWNSPTTKKHIAEAEVRGCELVGPGKNCHYRTYRLPCGHEQEFDIARIRMGSFRCRTCLDDRLNAEAAAQGCELLGPGNKKGYRMYRLPCGHEKKISTNGMRTGTFRCQTCLDDGLIAEAAAQGCELLGPGKTSYYRIYRLPCGHKQEAQPGKIRHGAFRCQRCLDDKLNAEAAAQNIELLRPGRKAPSRIYRLWCGHEQEIETAHVRRHPIRCRTCFQEELRAEAEAQDCELLRLSNNRYSRIYRLPCGHEQEVMTSHLRSGNFRCKACYLEKLIAEANSRGCDLLGPGKSFDYRLYQLPCGHTQEINVARVRDGVFSCQTCTLEKLTGEAISRDCELLGPGRNKDHRFYQLPCGHKQDIAVVNMRVGNFRCQSCEDYFYTQPSNVYLMHIKVGADEWLKLGYAKDLDFRIRQYRLPSEAEVTVIASLPFDTGKEAQEVEQALHKKYTRKRLHAEEMLKFHTGSGSTECYPLTMVEKLMLEMKAASL